MEHHFACSCSLAIGCPHIKLEPLTQALCFKPLSTLRLPSQRWCSLLRTEHSEWVNECPCAAARVANGPSQRAGECERSVYVYVAEFLFRSTLHHHHPILYGWPPALALRFAVWCVEKFKKPSRMRRLPFSIYHPKDDAHSHRRRWCVVRYML